MNSVAMSRVPACAAVFADTRVLVDAGSVDRNPSFIVKRIRSERRNPWAGPVNVTRYFLGREHRGAGNQTRSTNLRVVINKLCPDQRRRRIPLICAAAEHGRDVGRVAEFEFATDHFVRGVQAVPFGLRAGMRELRGGGPNAADRNFHETAHPMLSAGDRTTLGPLSQSDRVIERGNLFTMTFGLSGALGARAGWLEDEGELPEAIRDYGRTLISRQVRRRGRL